VLSAQGSVLAQEFLQFAAFNAATGSRAPDAGGYSDAASYPLVPLKALASAQGELVSDNASGLGAFYYSLQADAPTRLELDGDASRVAALLLPLVDDKLQVVDERPLPTTFEGAAVVVVTGQSLSRTDAPFTLRGKAPEAPAGSAEPGSSGCAVSAIPGQNSAIGGAWLGFVVILLGRWRARRSPRKGD
jgi:hypothetical protein